MKALKDEDKEQVSVEVANKALEQITAIYKMDADLNDKTGCRQIQRTTKEDRSYFGDSLRMS